MIVLLKRIVNWNGLVLFLFKNFDYLIKELMDFSSSCKQPFLSNKEIMICPCVFLYFYAFSLQRFNELIIITFYFLSSCLWELRSLVDFFNESDNYLWTHLVKSSWILFLAISQSSSVLLNSLDLQRKEHNLVTASKLVKQSLAVCLFKY